MGAERQESGLAAVLWLRCLMALLAVLAVGSAQAAAPPLSLAWPIDCRLGEDCWIVHLPDTDPGPAATDFRCGRLTYDGHKGTDIALRDRAALFRPVPVLAAAAGTVLGGRDSVADHLGDTSALKAAIDAGRECGNGLTLDHGSGWHTQYCHLKSGSLRVAKGQRVVAGQMLGHVGQSGAAEFPHLHLSVRHQGQEMDPFTRLPLGAGCETTAKGSLWTTSVAQTLPTADAPILTAIGFRQTAPLFDALKQDTNSPTTLSAEAPALVLWAMAFGLRAGDTLTFRINDGQGQTIHAKTFEQPKDQIRRLQFTGRRNTGWLRPGRYTGTVAITRQSPAGKAIIRQQQVSMQIAD